MDHYICQFRLRLVDKLVIKIMKRTFFRKEGQMLIELMVALGVLTVGFLGMVSLLSKAVALNRTISENYQATYLATEGVEIMKNLLDANLLQAKSWNSGFGTNKTYEVDFDSSWVSGKEPKEVLNSSEIRKIKMNESGSFNYIDGTVTPFSRRIEVELVGSYEVRVNSIVSWVSRGGGNFETNIEDHFYNWR